jgi:hypothetical protein
MSGWARWPRGPGIDSSSSASVPALSIDHGAGGFAPSSSRTPCACPCPPTVELPHVASGTHADRPQRWWVVERSRGPRIDAGGSRQDPRRRRQGAGRAPSAASMAAKPGRISTSSQNAWPGRARKRRGAEVEVDQGRRDGRRLELGRQQHRRRPPPPPDWTGGSGHGTVWWWPWRLPSLPRLFLSDGVAMAPPLLSSTAGVVGEGGGKRGGAWAKAAVERPGRAPGIGWTKRERDIERFSR